MIRRAFADLPDRQVHYRHAGEGEIPLVMLHASPGSSKQMEALVAPLSARTWVIAPDTPGYGDSPPLSNESPDIRDFALAALEFFDRLGLGVVDLYGSHTGASIATEIALQAPDRIRRIVLDGIGIFRPEERDEYLANYAPVLAPDLNGTHLTKAFMFCRDQFHFWPWYSRRAENARASGLPSARDLHLWVLEVLKALETYHLGYRASFAYPQAERLGQVTQALLAMVSETDPLRPHTESIVGFLPHVRLAITPRLGNPAAMSERVRLMFDFLGYPAA